MCVNAPCVVAARPFIGLLHLNNVRKGFCTRAQLDALLGHLPAPLRPPIRVAYITGWRIKSEVLSRQAHHVGLDAGWLRLDPGETKTGEGRMFPLMPELRAILEDQLAQTRALERETGRIIPLAIPP